MARKILMGIVDDYVPDLPVTLIIGREQARKGIASGRHVFKEARKQGLSPKEIRRQIEELREGGYLYEPKRNYFRLI